MTWPIAVVVRLILATARSVVATARRLFVMTRPLFVMTQPKFVMARLDRAIGRNLAPRAMEHHAHAITMGTQ